MYSPAIPGLNVFCDYVFFVFSGVSRETATSFVLFLIVATTLRKRLVSCQDCIDFLLLQQIVDLLFFEGKSFNNSEKLVLGK